MAEKKSYKKMNVHIDLVKLIEGLKKDIEHFGWGKIKVSDVDATAAFAEKLKEKGIVVINEKGGKQ